MDNFRPEFLPNNAGAILGEANAQLAVESLCQWFTRAMESGRSASRHTG